MELSRLQKCKTESFCFTFAWNYDMAVSTCSLFISLDWQNSLLLKTCRLLVKKDTGINEHIKTQEQQRIKEEIERSFRTGTEERYIWETNAGQTISQKPKGSLGPIDPFGSNVIYVGCSAGRVWWNSLWDLCWWQLIWAQLFSRYVWFFMSSNAFVKAGSHIWLIQLKTPERLFLARGHWTVTYNHTSTGETKGDNQSGKMQPLKRGMFLWICALQSVTRKLMLSGKLGTQFPLPSFQGGTPTCCWPVQPFPKVFADPGFNTDVLPRAF